MKMILAALMMVCIGGHFTMDPVGAAQAVEWVNPKQGVPMHFGTYGLLKGTPAQFKDALDQHGLGRRIVEMKPGETRTFRIEHAYFFEFLGTKEALVDESSVEKSMVIW